MISIWQLCDVICIEHRIGYADYPIQKAVYNHDPFQNTIRAGRTPTEVEFWFNTEFMACDLKISIAKTWPEALSILEKEYPDSATSAIVSDATMQYIKR